MTPLSRLSAGAFLLGAATRVSAQPPARPPPRTLVPSTQRVRNEVFSDAEKTSADALVGALMSLGDFDAKTLVNAFQGPKVAIVAADLEGPASFQRQFPDIRARRIVGTGHWIMLDKPVDVNAALDEFMREVGAGARR